MARLLTRRIKRVLMIYAIRCTPHRVRRLGSLRCWSDGLACHRPRRNDAHQQAADLNVIFNQYGQRNEKDHREVEERWEWWARVRGRDGRQVWIKAADLRPLKESGSAPVVVYPVRRTPTEWRNRLSLCTTSSDPACAGRPCFQVIDLDCRAAIDVLEEAHPSWNCCESRCLDRPRISLVRKTERGSGNQTR
jgi:hypothetical protein